MPESEIVSIGSLATNDVGAFKIGPFGSSLKKSELVASGIPVVGIENVLPNQFEKSCRRFVTPSKFEELSDYAVRAEDVLVTTMGTIGRAAVVPAGFGPAIIDSHLFRMRFDPDRAYAPYICYAINSRLVAAQLEAMARGAIMDGLNTTILKQCVIPLPSRSEQQRVARLLGSVENLRAVHVEALRQADHLFQSLLHRAFV